MLRITESRTPDGGIELRLEGRLFGPWVRELRRVAERAAARGALRLDLSAVTFVDPEGRETLRGLLRAGAGCVGCGPFVRALLEEEDG